MSVHILICGYRLMYVISVCDVCDRTTSQYTVENLWPGTVYKFSLSTVLNPDDGTVLYSHPATLKKLPLVSLTFVARPSLEAMLICRLLYQSTIPQYF